MGAPTRPRRLWSFVFLVSSLLRYGHGEITFLALDQFVSILTASENEGEKSGLMLCFVMWLAGMGNGVQH